MMAPLVKGPITTLSLASAVKLTTAGVGGHIHEYDWVKEPALILHAYSHCMNSHLCIGRRPLHKPACADRHADRRCRQAVGQEIARVRIRCKNLIGIGLQSGRRDDRSRIDHRHWVARRSNRFVRADIGASRAVTVAVGRPRLAIDIGRQQTETSMPRRSRHRSPSVGRESECCRRRQRRSARR